MAWFAVVEKATGKLISTGEIVAGTLDPALEVIPIAEQPGTTMEWDEATKALKPRPVEAPRLDQFLGDSTIVNFLNNLTPAQRTALRNKLEQYLR